MDEYQEPKTEHEERGISVSSFGVWLVVIAALVIALFAFGYGYKEESRVNQATQENSNLNSQIAQMQSQVVTMSDKLNQMSAAQEQAAEAAKSVAGRNSTAASKAARRRLAADNKQMKQMQGQLADEQQQLNDAKDQIAQSRSDLENSINSTRDDLNGSIARTHDELVALEQRGQRNYYEFDLSTKPRTFVHSGPIQISLRKADVKHKDFDLAMIVDDSRMMKKRVNLYEPIWVSSDEGPETLQIVVNKITKNHVHGYVSAPKFAAGVTPVSTNPAPSSQNPPASQTAPNSSPTNPSPDPKLQQ